MTKRLLNLGCGHRFHNEWTNVDFKSTGKNVIAYNLLKGIPFKDGIFDMVYHSHIIEHFSKEDAPKFLMECYRVLKPNGIIRIAFPDLEQIVYHYMKFLKELKNGNKQYESDYDWIMLELYDQTVRNVSGGEMAKYLMGGGGITIPNENFILKRCGIEMKKIIEAGKNYKYSRKKLFKESIKQIRQKLFGKYLLGKFRLSGEIHQWMYDSFSLSRLLETEGFLKIVIRDAFTSYLEEWKEYNLDTEPDGSIYKPDSNYIEAIK